MVMYTMKKQAFEILNKKDEQEKIEIWKRALTSPISSSLLFSFISN